MELDETNSVLHHTIDIHTPPKVNRRSSIFKPHLSVADEKYVGEEFDLHYINKLIEEITEWKLFYTKIKEEYNELKSRRNKEASDEKPLELKFADYPMKVEQLINRINSVVNMHKHLLRYKSIRMEQIENDIKIGNTLIRNKLNFH